MSKWDETKKILDQMDREMLYKGGKYLPKFKRCTRTEGEINFRLQALYHALRSYESTPLEIETVAGKHSASVTFVLDPNKA